MNEILAKAIMQAMQQRLGKGNLVCGMCGGTRWQAGNIVNLPAQDNISTAVIIGGKSLPLVAMICEVCGLTQFHNIIKLLGKERFEEIVKQQQETTQAIHEAEEIVKKQKEVEP